MGTQRRLWRGVLLQYASVMLVQRVAMLGHIFMRTQIKRLFPDKMGSNDFFLCHRLVRTLCLFGRNYIQSLYPL